MIVGYGACDGRIFFNLARVIVGYSACDGRIFQGFLGEPACDSRIFLELGACDSRIVVRCSLPQLFGLVLGNLCGTEESQLTSLVCNFHLAPVGFLDLADESQ